MHLQLEARASTLGSQQPRDPHRVKSSVVGKDKDAIVALRVPKRTSRSCYESIAYYSRLRPNPCCAILHNWFKLAVIAIIGEVLQAF